MCDRPDATVREELVCWPDDSSHHLAACLPPGRREKWLDLGCGSGFAPLARPELATSICGTDLNTRALDHAALGAALSGVRLEVFDGDVGANVPASWRGSCELVSCNAPIPAAANISRTTPAAETFAGTAPVWRHAASDVVERMVDAAASFAARDATIVLHAAHDALAAVLARRRGDRTIVRYTPDDVSGFAVAWWQPDGEERLVERVRLLTRDAPHLTFDDR
ncbi:MAG: methyltransferase [Kofleriaceae bacterium]|nr:methyltransferase [Kofleriaceae bacterium]